MMAMDAPPETTAFVAMLDPTRAKPDSLAVVDLDPASKTYGQVVGNVDMPNTGDELHHFGWNACSSCLCPYSPHPHMERRYLVVPGMRSSRIHIIDSKPDPRQPKIVKVIEPETVMHLSSSIWLWHKGQNGTGDFQVRKIIEIPAEPADPETLPPLLQVSKQYRRWLRTSTSRSTTGVCTFPLGDR